jgi:hypothetical protein
VIELQSPIPDLAGAHCEALIAQEFWHGGERVSPANVLFLKTEAGSWQRIVLDAGVLFWRTEAEPSFPTPADDSPEYGQHPLVDLAARHGLVGRRIEAVRVAERPDGDELQLEFSEGVVVALRDLRDQDATDLEIRVPAA